MTADRFAHLIADTAAMVRFYSRLPIPRVNAVDQPEALPDFTTAARMLPIASILIAVPASLVLLGLSLTRLPDLVVAALAIAALVATTGVFHEDGLADTADGFGGGWTRERKLEIMKDSRIGSYGAAALILVTLLRVACLAALIDLHGGLASVAAFIAIAVVARTAPLTLFATLPLARPDGVARAAGQPNTDTLLVALPLAGLIALFLAGSAVSVVSVVAALLFTVAVTAGMGWLAQRHIQGQTGDVLGATSQVVEVAFLIGLLM